MTTPAKKVRAFRVDMGQAPAMMGSKDAPMVYELNPNGRGKRGRKEGGRPDKKSHRHGRNDQVRRVVKKQKQGRVGRSNRRKKGSRKEERRRGGAN